MFYFVINMLIITLAVLCSHKVSLLSCLANVWLMYVWKGYKPILHWYSVWFDYKHLFTPESLQVWCCCRLPLVARELTIVHFDEPSWFCLCSARMRTNLKHSPSSQQDRSRPFDGFSMHSLESSLIDIMRAEQDSLKGNVLITSLNVLAPGTGL